MPHCNRQIPRAPASVGLDWQPGGRRNRAVECGWARRGDYEFSLCHRQDLEDACLFRLFVYRLPGAGGYKHLGGFMTEAAAKACAEAWDAAGP